MLARGLDAVIRMAPRHQWLMPSIPKEVLSDTELDQVIWSTWWRGVRRGNHDKRSVGFGPPREQVRSYRFSTVSGRRQLIGEGACING